MQVKTRNVLVTPETTDIILESISDGVFTVDREWRVISFNRAAEEITGIPREEAIGRRCCEVFRASMCETECALRRTLDSGKAIINKSAFIVDTASGAGRGHPGRRGRCPSRRGGRYYRVLRPQSFKAGALIPSAAPDVEGHWA